MFLFQYFWKKNHCNPLNFVFFQKKNLYYFFFKKKKEAIPLIDVVSIQKETKSSSLATPGITVKTKEKEVSQIFP